MPVESHVLDVKKESIFLGFFLSIIFLETNCSYFLLFSLQVFFMLQVGTITLLALTGLLVFMLFFVAATFNAIIISLLMSLAAAGGFLAFFFACVTAIYIGALSVAVFVISTATIVTIVAVLIATGRAILLVAQNLFV